MMPRKMGGRKDKGGT
jgi:hypothetical protein